MKKTHRLSRILVRSALLSGRWWTIRCTVYKAAGPRFFNSQFPAECSRDFLMDTFVCEEYDFLTNEDVQLCMQLCLKWGASEWRGFKCTQDPGDHITLMSCCIYWSMTNRFLILKDRSDWSKWMRQPVFGQWGRGYFWTVGVSGGVLSFVKCAVTGFAWQSHGKYRGWRRQHFSIVSMTQRLLHVIIND